MEKSATKIIIHSTESGKLYIKEDEFFNNLTVKETLKKVKESSAVKKIREAKEANHSVAL